jgi:hypothetical protein
MDGACTRHRRGRTRFIAYRDHQSRKRFRGRLTGASKAVALNSSHEPPRPALQKYNVKSLDLLFVTATDSFVRKL